VITGAQDRTISIAQAFEQEMAGQRISHEEITYITEKLIPTVERLAEKTMDDNSEVSEFVGILTLGFHGRAA
jgi:hypothetical protein